MESEQKELCAGCPWGSEPSVLTALLIDKLFKMDIGAQIGEHALTSAEWRLLDMIEQERRKLYKEEIRQKNASKDKRDTQ